MESKSVARERRFKEQAERLREFLAAAGVELKHTTSLQALAHMHKAQDWRALLASTIQPEAALAPAPSRLISLTMVADSAHAFFGARRFAVRVDQIANFTDVSADKYNPKANSIMHLIEPADWEADSVQNDGEDYEGGQGGVVRAYRQICVLETFDEIEDLIGLAPDALEGRQRAGSA